MSYQFYVPTRTLFGAGKLNELHLQTMPGRKAMVVISNGKSMKETGTLDRVLKELESAGVETVVFDHVQANPLRSVVMEGAAYARANDCDFVVALGGGSVMDASKAMAAMAANDGDIWDYMNGGTGGGKTLMEKALPVICITTTAGTGSEADQWGVITNDETNEKIGFGGYDCLFPVLSVVDPELMISVAYYQHFVDCHACDERFVTMAKALGKADASSPQDFVDMLVKLQKDCGVYDLKMSDFGIQREELDRLAENARETMGGLFTADPNPLSHEECVAIYQTSYK